MTKRDLVAKSSLVIDGTAFEADDGTLFIFSAPRTRQKAEGRAAAACAETRVLAVRAYWSLLPKDWTAMDPSFWKWRPNRNERQANYHCSDCLRAYKNYVGSTFPLQTRLVRLRARE